MSDKPTPRTDAVARRVELTSGYCFTVTADFARKLEQELNEAKDRTSRDWVFLMEQCEQLKTVCDELVSSKKCPNCDDVGWFMELRRTTFGEPEPEQRQCEFCYLDPKSRFNTLNTYNSLPHVIAKRKTK